MEEETADVGDALACELLAQGLQEQAEREGHVAGKCGGCGEPIPVDEIAGRLLQAKRGEAVWQESYGRLQAMPQGFFSLTPKSWESRRMTRSVRSCSARWFTRAVTPVVFSRPART